MNCRHCNQKLNHVFVDLVNCPPSNAMLRKEQLNHPEKFYPLKIFVCEHCFLVQVDEIAKASDIFDGDYTYFSSFSATWLQHAKNYVDLMMGRLNLAKDSLVIEVASNDGYLLQYFKEYGIPVMGVDPTSNTAEAAKKKGIHTIVDFFGSRLASEQFVAKGLRGDLILGNNVLAHVPDINDFVKGLKLALKDEGVMTVEFPHLLKLIEECQFDTIYHEHFSYLSFTTVKRIFELQELEVFDVEELPTHGGSLRVFAKHPRDSSKKKSENVDEMIEKERRAGMTSIQHYLNFQYRVDEIKYEFWEFLIQQKRKGKKVIGYGAAAKGNTLLNYTGVKGNDLIQFVVDASPHKQEKYLPGSHIPVVDKDRILEYKPDYVIIFPWNLKEEISQQLHYIREWNGQFVVLIPKLEIFAPQVTMAS